jgi:erythronate-4-phosphate dehydrogenase
MKIVADNNIPFLKGVLESYATIEYYPGAEITNEVVKDADALIVRTRTKCYADLLKDSKVRFITTATIGFDHIDTTYCKSNGIKWANAPGCNSGSVMQYIASVFVFLSEKNGFNYQNKTLGVIGVGNVGSKVVSLASALGMKVLLNDPPRERKEGKGKFVSLKEIKQKADIITFHVPLNRTGIDKTLHLADDSFFRDIHPETIIINSSRGEVISTSSLLAALKQKKIKAAVLDVWEKEPDINTELLNLVDIGTPHIAGYSTDGKAMGTAMSVQAISRYFGFKLNDWIPVNLPQISDNLIEINCDGLSFQEVINKAIKKTYDVTKENITFKNSPQTFEMHRTNYPVRREFGFYKLKLINDRKNFKSLLHKIGFTLY